MTIDSLLTNAVKHLRSAGIATARLDCLILLEDVLNTNRTQILAHPEQELTEVQRRKFDDMLAKRASHLPLAYIRGKTEFYGRQFDINEHVLEPRPESETMIDLLKKLTNDCPSTIIDIGTGSGALAITARLEQPHTNVYATDIDLACIDLAKHNANSLGATIEFFEGDLLNALPPLLMSQPKVMLCNLPYVPDNFQINTAATHEPSIAIFGGVDGLDLYRRLFDQLSSENQQGTYIFCESLPLQHDALTEIAEKANFQPVTDNDFIQVFRNSPSVTN